MKNKLTIALSLVIIFFSILSYFFFDLSIAAYFHKIKQTRINVKIIFETITAFGRAELFLVPSIIVFFIFRKRKKTAQTALFIFSTVAVSGIIVDIIKVIAGRFRPVLYFSQNLYGFDFFHIDADFLSFPSGHSATSLSIAAALFILYPRLRGLFIILGITVASSRMVITAHYLSDVLIGCQA